VRVAKGAVITGTLLLSNLLDAGLESINKALKLPVGKAGAPIEGQGRSGNYTWLPHQAEPERIEAQVRSFLWWDLEMGNILVGGGTVRDTTCSFHLR
jgi:hypothetical protein